MKRSGLVLLAVLLACGACTCSRRGATRAADPAPVDRPPPPPLVPAPPDLSHPPENAERLPNGIASTVLAEGMGDERARPDQWVRFHYTVWDSNGQMFDSSVRRRQPAETIVSRAAIPAWVELLPRMAIGEKRRYWIPAALAFQGRPGPQGDVVCELELLAIRDAPPDPEPVRANDPADEVSTETIVAP